MPVYVYRRSDGSTFETKQLMAEEALVACPTTGQPVARVLQPFTPRYKGTGFYSTDHRTPDGERQAAKVTGRSDEDASAARSGRDPAARSDRDSRGEV